MIVKRCWSLISAVSFLVAFVTESCGVIPDGKAIDSLLRMEQIDSLFISESEKILRGVYEHNEDSIQVFIDLSKLSEKFLRNSLAKAYALKTIQKSVAKGVNHSLATGYDLLSNSYELVGSFDSAINLKLKALRIRETQGDDAGMLRSYYNVGRFYYNRRMMDEAVEYADKCYKKSLTSKDTVLRGKSLMLLGMNYYFLEVNDSAEIFLLRAYNWNKKHNDTSTLIETLNALGLYYRVIENYPLAVLNFNEGISLARHANYWNLLGRMYTNFGLSYLDETKYDAAAIYLEYGRVLAEYQDNKLTKLRSYEYLAEAYHFLGIHDSSWIISQRAYKLNEEMHNANYSRAIAEMQTKYDTETLELQNFRRTRERNATFVGLIVLGLIAILAVGYFRQRAINNRNKVAISRQRIDYLLKYQEIESYNSLIEGQQSERKRIAEDLHDRLGSMLATVKMHFNALWGDTIPAESRVSKHFEIANDLLDEACTEVRKVAHNLNSGLLSSFGLVPALKELCESVESSGYIKIKALAFGLDDRLDSTMEVPIYRMIQECISNILKHANAKNITIQLNKTDDQVNILIEDDGGGFNVDEKLKEAGMGMKNIIMRAEQLNGKVEFDSRISKGTTVIIDIPLNSQST